MSDQSNLPPDAASAVAMYGPQDQQQGPVDAPDTPGQQDPEEIEAEAVERVQLELLLCIEKLCKGTAVQTAGADAKDFAQAAFFMAQAFSELEKDEAIPETGTAGPSPSQAGFGASQSTTGVGKTPAQGQ